MTMSEMLKAHVDEHNARVKAAQDGLARKRALEAELQAGFAEREKQDRKFNAWALAKVRELIALDEANISDLGHAIDTLETPAPDGQSAQLLDMTGAMRRAGE